MINHGDTIIMLLATILSGFASTMNIWVDKWDDIRFSLNDVYMVGLMTGWMFFFMGLFSMQLGKCLIGFSIAIIFFILIRTQWFVTEIQYLQGMIPHHSMAIMMSKHLKKHNNNITQLLNNIIKSQEKEIIDMKLFEDLNNMLKIKKIKEMYIHTMMHKLETMVD